MKFFKQLVTAIRRGGRELGEAVLDSQGIGVYEQEIEGAKRAVKEAKHDLSGIQAKLMQTGREIGNLEQTITDHEKKALIALDQGNEGLAGEAVNKIVELEMELETHNNVKKELATQVNQIKGVIKAAQAQIHAHEREIALVKTADKVHQASKSISQYINGGRSNMMSATESLERIKLRLQDESDRMAAAEALRAELSGQSLEAKLKAAGIGAEANRKKQVLDRLKAAHQGPAIR